jgi:hypothetical protein
MCKDCQKQVDVDIIECSECYDFFCNFFGINIEKHVQIIENETDYYNVNNHQCPLKNNIADINLCNICIDKSKNKEDELSDEELSN